MLNCAGTKVAMCAIVLYRKWTKGRLYPKAARTGPYAFAQEVNRVDGRVVTRYIGIVQVPDGTKVAKMEGESVDDNSSGQESLQQELQ
jgi:hypothetical protein